MKNRRLNVLFIAIIALAAAPQALLDAHRLANAAQDRAETEFWSIFLSYQSQDAYGTEKGAETGLEAARRREETGSRCLLEQKAEQPVEVARTSQSNESLGRVRAVNPETVRRSANADFNFPVTVEMDSDDEAVAAVREMAFSNKEQKAMKSAGLHARDTEKVADNAPKAGLASLVQRNGEMQIKVRQLVEMDKLLREKIRYMEDSGEAGDDIPVPGPVGSM